jgi:hypothetical protein
VRLYVAGYTGCKESPKIAILGLRNAISVHSSKKELRVEYCSEQLTTVSKLSCVQFE